MKQSVVVGILALFVGIAGGWGMRSYLDTQSSRESHDNGEQLRSVVKSIADSLLAGHEYRIFKASWNETSGAASIAVDGKSLCLIDLRKDLRTGQWLATKMQCRKAKNQAELDSGITIEAIKAIK